MTARALLERAARREPGAIAILGDYLAEHWIGFRFPYETPEGVLKALIYGDELTPRALHRLGCAFAEHVLHLYENRLLRDQRPRHAIRCKQDWLRDLCSPAKLSDARASAASAEKKCPQRYGLAARAAAGAAAAASATGDVRDNMWMAANRAAAALAHHSLRKRRNALVAAAAAAGQAKPPDLSELESEERFRAAWLEGCRALLPLLSDELELLGL